MNPSIPRLDLLRSLQLFYQHRVLLLELARREITDRYAGQVFGALWAIGHPLLLVLVYIFIFGHVFAVRMGATQEMPLDYTAYLLAGLFPWMAFQESLSKGSTAIVANTSLVKQVVFPLEVLPTKVVLATLVTQFVGTGCLGVHILISTGRLPWTFALLPVLWLFQLLAMTGASMFLAAIGAYFRDIKEFIQVGCVIGMYLMPIVYLPQWVPDSVRPLLYLNPFSYMIWCYQDAAYFGSFDHWWAWPVFLGGSLLVFSSGCKIFGKLKVFFGNVL